MTFITEHTEYTSPKHEVSQKSLYLWISHKKKDPGAFVVMVKLINRLFEGKVRYCVRTKQVRDNQWDAKKYRLIKFRFI